MSLRIIHTAPIATINFEDEFDDRNEMADNEGTTLITMKPKCMVCRIPSSLKCTRCKRVFYCSKEHQSQDWKIHREECKMDQEKDMNPIILVVAVAGALGLVRDMKKSFFDSLADTMHFWFATTDSEATRKLRSISRPRSVWVVDTIPSREHSTLLQLIAFYVRKKGLNVVFSAGFPAFAKWPDIEGIFGEFGKSWRSGGYRRDDVHLKATTHSNRHDPERKNDPPIGELLKRTPSRWAESYSMKALRPQGISSTGIIYLPEEFRDDLKRFLDDPEEFRDLKELDFISHLEAPIVFSKVGRGWLGYIGDVNDEQTSDAVLTAMLDIHR